MKQSVTAVIGAGILAATAMSATAELKTEIGLGEGQLDIIA